MTEVLITGANGMLGRDLREAFVGRPVTALARDDLDIRDAPAVDDAVEGHGVVVNCAAYTRVDDAETNEADAYAVNAVGAANLAAACARTGARLVTISTDYVFEGTATSPYSEDRPRNPINAYGRTKAAGEEAVLRIHPEGAYVVRTAWLYGEHGPNFASTMLRLAATKDRWTVVHDQLGQPTWTVDLAQRIVALVEGDGPPGIYHGTNSGEATWYEFARAVLSAAGEDPDRVTPTDSAAFQRPAARPAYSVLGHARWAEAGLEPMRHWRDALNEAVARGAIRAA